MEKKLKYLKIINSLYIKGKISKKKYKKELNWIRELTKVNSI